MLLKDPVGADLTAMAFARRGNAIQKPQQMPVSRSITDYVLRHGTAVRTSDASLDERFSAGNSIVSEGIREAICAPMRGRSDLLGVFYLDTTMAVDQAMSGAPKRLTDEHLRTVVTVARQAALALESRQFQDAMVRAERFAAMGQTITVVSHHIKNILQGFRGGSLQMDTWSTPGTYSQYTFPRQNGDGFPTVHHRLAGRESQQAIQDL